MLILKRLLSLQWVPQSSIFWVEVLNYAKAFDCVDHNKLWKILKEMGIPDHLTCLLRNLCAGQEATVGTGHGTTDWFQTGKGTSQGCTLSPCLFNLHAEYIQRGQWHPTLVLLPGKSHGRRSLVGCSPRGHDWATSLSFFTFMHWRRKWQPTPVFLPGGSQGWRSLVGCCLWGRMESDMTEAT